MNRILNTFLPQEIEEHIQFNSTPFKISTITALGSIGADVNLQVLFEKVALDINTLELAPIYIEYGRTKSEHSFRGIHHKPKKNLRNQVIDVKVKRFDNQATFDYKLGTTYHINTKVFNNGTIHMTGIKSIPDGQRVINDIIDRVHAISIETEKLNEENAVNVVPINSKLIAGPLSVHLINSDFKVNFKLKREVLHEILVRTYKNKCTYEPCIYPGVKLQYFWNTATKNNNNDGNCQCPGSHCAGKGRGDQIGHCKKVTIGVFQSGCVIITGASMVEQIEECYTYICRVMHENMNEIRRRNYMVPGPEQAEAMLTAMM
jgi:TATA-box binding protein (TBP) (component of TFIID and TFIIIB)